MFILIYFIGVLLSIYLSLTLFVRMNRYYYQNRWFEHISSSDLIGVTVIGMASWLGVITTLFILTFETNYGFFANAQLFKSEKFKRFIEIITFRKD